MPDNPNPNPKGISFYPGLTLTSNQPFTFTAQETIQYATTPFLTVYAQQFDAGGAMIRSGGLPYHPVAFTLAADTVANGPCSLPTNATGPWLIMNAALGASYSPGTVGAPTVPPQVVTIHFSATAIPASYPGSTIRLYFSLAATSPPPAGSFWEVSAPIPVVGV